MKTKVIVLSAMALSSFSLLSAQEIILPLTETSEARPKSMSIPSVSSEFIQAFYDGQSLTVYVQNFKGTATLTILDELGNTIEKESQIIKTSGTITVSIAGLKPGNYILKVKTSKNYVGYFQIYF